MSAPSCQKHEILRARAKALAREPQAPPARDGYVTVVEFTLGGERYAFESTLVREVCPVKDLTPLPCTPPFVVGIVNARGHILAVIDVREFFDLPKRGVSEASSVIVIATGDGAFGVLADAVIGVYALPLTDLQPSLPTLTGIRADYLRGITGQRLVVLDAAKIRMDEKLIVNEQVKGSAQTNRRHR